MVVVGVNCPRCNCLNFITDYYHYANYGFVVDCYYCGKVFVYWGE